VSFKLIARKGEGFTMMSPLEIVTCIIAIISGFMQFDDWWNNNKKK
jgi:hypothetical protein